MNIFAIRIVILLTGIYMFGTLILIGLTFLLGSETLIKIVKVLWVLFPTILVLDFVLLLLFMHSC